jgi:hypothetical protein
MIKFRPSSSLLGLVVWLALAPLVHALDDSGAKLVVSKFLASQNSEQGSASEGQHAITDLDGDGKSDIVLLWDVLGPTSSLPKLTLFLDQGKNYRTLTTDLNGQTQGLTVKGSVIMIDTLTLGPKDPLCCPTVKQQLVFRWAGGKLTQEK